MSSKKYELDIKAFVSTIPYIGGAAVSIHNDIQIARKFRRYSDFLSELKRDIERLQLDQQINMNVMQEDLLDIFENISHHVMNERTQEKRVAYKNIFINTISNEDFDFDETEQMIQLVERLSLNHIHLLTILSNPSNLNELSDSPVSSGRMTTTFIKTISLYLPNWNQDDIMATILDLESMYLCQKVSDNFRTMITNQGVQTIANKLTKRGKDLINYITQIEH